MMNVEMEEGMGNPSGRGVVMGGRGGGGRNGRSKRRGRAGHEKVGVRCGLRVLPESFLL